MKKNFTKIVFILDASGSMCHLRDDTIGGFNAMIEEQKGQPGTVSVTTVLFDTEVSILHDNVPLEAMEPLTRNDYCPGGGTALLDAVGGTIDVVGEELAALPEEERPDKVLFIITTDGQENASRAFSKEMVQQRIHHQQSKYNWRFIFLGANIDAVSTGASLGFGSGYSKTYTATQIGTESVYRAMSKTITTARSADSIATLDAAINTCLNEVQ